MPIAGIHQGASARYGLIKARQQFQIFLGHRFQWISGATPGAQAARDHVSIKSFFPQQVRHTGASGFA
jgi:hypothetical protein